MPEPDTSATDDTQGTNAGAKPDDEAQNAGGSNNAGTTGNRDDQVDEELLKGADNPDAVRNAINRQKDEAKAAKKRAADLEAEVQKYKDRDKSDQERLEERATKSEGRVTELEGENARLRVAIDKGLVGDRAYLVDRLKGNTQEELAADADELLKRIGTGQNGSTTDFDGGARGSSTPVDMNARIRQAAGRG